MIASDLTARSMLVLPRDAGQLGLDPDELEIAEAVRMSMSIPIFFKPMIAGGAGAGAVSGSGPPHVIVDGGLLSNYPIWLFDAPAGQRPQFPTFGMLLVAPGPTAPLLATPPSAAELPRVGGNIAFLKAIVDTMMEAHDRLYVQQADYARTIPIPTLGVRTTEFDITPAQTAALFESGRSAAATWRVSTIGFPSLRRR